MREREVNELERAGGKYGERGGGVYEVIEKWGGAEGGEVSHKTRERMEVKTRTVERIETRERCRGNETLKAESE